MLAIVVVTLWHTVLVAPGLPVPPGAELTPWLSATVWLGATVTCLVRAVSVATDRLAWSSMSVALAASSAAAFAQAMTGSSVDGAWAAVANVSALAFYPFAYASIMMMVRARVAEFTASTWLDGLVSGLAAAAVVATLAFDNLTAASDQSRLMVLVQVTYPVADLLLVALVVAFFAVTGWRPGRAWLALLSGLLCLVGAHTYSLVQLASADRTGSSWVDGFGLIGAVGLAAAAWASTAAQITVRTDWRTLATPILSVVVAVGVLAHRSWEGGGEAATDLALAAILLATGRAMLAFRELRALADTRREAHTDALTGLPNRRRLFSVLEQRIRHQEPFAVLLLDLDGFKEINDTLGHSTGDLLLTQVARRLDDHRHPDDILARLGGDEFAMVATGPLDVEAARTVARRMAEALLTPFRLGPVSVTMEVSTGLALYPDHADNASDLLSRADVAMYQAKRDRSEHAVYDPTRYDHSADRLGVVAALREGLARGELVVHYQPQVQLGTGALVGVEALARWQHPEHGLLGPDDFMPAVEHTNLMRPFTEELLRIVLEQMRAWRETGSARLRVPVSLNVAAPNLVDRTFADTVSKLLAEYDVLPRELVIEVTENAVLTDAERAMRVLHELRDLGVGLSIDDFGTGLSSLQRLRMLPVDELKIDKSFVGGLPDDIRDSAVVEASITLARRMGLQIIAEGAETEAICRELMRLGCDRAQGFLFAQPLSARSLEAWDFARSSTGRHRSTAPRAADAIGRAGGLAGT